jgi:hypothetical protein
MYRMQADGLALVSGELQRANPGDQVLGIAGSVFENSIAIYSGMPVEARALVINSVLNSMTPGLFIAYWGSMFFYFTLTLYQTRKDRSILFYNSMPISDRQTVLSKLLAGLLAVPLVYLVALLLMQLLMLVIFSIVGLATGMDSNIYAVFWQPAAPIANVLSVLLLVPLGALWALPIYGALLLGSAWARSAPFAWVAALPVAVVAIEGIVYESTRTIALLVRHSDPYWLYGGPIEQSLGDRLASVMNLEMACSIAVGILFVWLAIRFNRSEDC